MEGRGDRDNDRETPGGGPAKRPKLDQIQQTDNVSSSSQTSSSPNSEPIVKIYPANAEQFTTCTPDSDEAPSSCDTASKGSRDSDDPPHEWSSTPPFMLLSSPEINSPPSKVSTQPLQPNQEPLSQTPTSTPGQQLERGDTVMSASQLGSSNWSVGSDWFLLSSSSQAPAQDLASDSDQRFLTPPEKPPSPDEDAESAETTYLKDLGKYNQQPPM